MFNTTLSQKERTSAVHLDKSIFIRADPEQVYAWLAPHRQPSWDRSLVRATALADGRFDLVDDRSRRLDERPHPGMTFVLVGRAFGHRFETHAEATQVEDARAFAWRQLDGDYEEHRGAYTLEPVPEGTRLHLVADVDFPYVMPEVVTESELARTLSDGADDALLTLKDIVERGRAAR